MNRNIIGGLAGVNQAKDNENALNIEFVMMTDGLTKSILTMLLKKYTLYIETNDRRLLVGTYKNIKLLGRTNSDIILIFDLLTEKEVRIDINNIRIVRVSK